MKKNFKIPELTFSSDHLRTLSSDKSEIPVLGESIPVDFDGTVVDSVVVGLEFTTDSNYVGIVISTCDDGRVAKKSL